MLFVTLYLSTKSDNFWSALRLNRRPLCVGIVLQQCPSFCPLSFGSPVLLFKNPTCFFLVIDITDGKCGEGILTAGRAYGGTCAPWTWQPTVNDNLEMNFTQMAEGEPNCDVQYNREQCMEYFIRKEYDWNDAYCGRKACFLCEYGPYN